ncbi:VOC family protein [Pseudogulbenkiania subflava]|uniref:Catechol-2,3-dioxygenase n=1 Tax=Pseudogulbenkiania subflava DSM 22618 TaxID=1123014 RepID=A0A1Y6C7P0_9NEIS|nr:VOC family protein [Pseudogulbenkiania subflava]SMF49169.1 Catechol-2,3-dioxygenase [Pseudogulbenkiania subflava DSM 22618]
MSGDQEGWAEAGVHSIHSFGLFVPDIDEAKRFINAFGLSVEQRGNVLLVRVFGDDHVWLKVIQAERKALAYLSLGCYEDDFEQIRHQILAAGGRPAESSPYGSQQGFWFHDPDGNLIQLWVAPKMMPGDKAQLGDKSVPVGIQGAFFRSTAPKIQPSRLAHMLFFTGDMPRTLQFYEEGLGVKVADRSKNLVAFTYARHGCDHHLIAFVASEQGRGFHHSAWDVPSIECVGLGAEQMRAAGYLHHWGVGRHVLGSNYFDYVQDPFGSWWEYSAHIDYIPKGVKWNGGDRDPADSLYLWGPSVPECFVQNNEINS